MKAVRLAILILVIFVAGLAYGRLSKRATVGPLGTDEMVQMGIVVKDIEKVSQAYAEILGTEVPA